MTGKPVPTAVPGFRPRRASHCSGQENSAVAASGICLRVWQAATFRIRHTAASSQRSAILPETLRTERTAQPLGLHQLLQRAGNVKPIERL